MKAKSNLPISMGLHICFYQTILKGSLPVVGEKYERLVLSDGFTPSEL